MHFGGNAVFTGGGAGTNGYTNATERLRITRNGKVGIEGTDMQIIQNMI